MLPHCDAVGARVNGFCSEIGSSLKRLWVSLISSHQGLAFPPCRAAAGRNSKGQILGLSLNFKMTHYRLNLLLGFVVAKG